MDAVQSVCMTLLQICSQMLSVCLCSSVPFLFIFWFLVKLTLKSFSAVFPFLTVRVPYVLKYQYFTSFEFVTFQQCQSILICKHLLSSWSISFSFFKVLRLVVVPACPSFRLCVDGYLSVSPQSSMASDVHFQDELCTLGFDSSSAALWACRLDSSKLGSVLPQHL